MASRLSAWRCCRLAVQRGQALLETALVVPLLLLLAVGVVGVGRVVQAQLGVSAVAREAARAAALAQTASEARAQGLAHGQAVADGYYLRREVLQLSVEPGAFGRGGQVRAVAHYEVALADLPLLSWTRVTVSSDQVERLDLYRSRWPPREEP